MKFSTSAVIAFAAAAASVPAALAADTTLYKVANSECGQATLDSKYATYAEEFAGLKEGTCSSQGYTASAGSKSTTVPVLGKITVELFKKPTAEAEAAASDYVDIVTFDGAKSTTYTFHDLNDPVMGGLSKSTFTVDKTGSFAVFNGTVAIVPSLKAPGFCNAETLNPFAKFADASGKTHLWIKARTTTPNYPGYKVSLAADTFNPQFKSFKANFDLKGNDGKTFEWVGIPFVPAFSNDWSAFTGDCDTKDPNGGKQHVCCKTGKEDVCMTEKNKKDFSQVGFWTEGHAGDFHIEIERIGAGGATAPAL